VPLPWSGELAGRLDRHVVASETLRGNPLGDPHERPLHVYVPPGYDDEPDRRYASIYVIQGYTGRLAMWDNRTPFRQPFYETADQVFASGQAPPAVMVFVDARTSYGGSQFVDSPGTGDYHSYLCHKVAPWVDAHYRTALRPEHHGITGGSSGGFGTCITPMLGPDLFGGFARTRATRCTSTATCRSSPRWCGRCGSTTATCRRGGPTFAAVRRSRSPPTGSC